MKRNCTSKPQKLALLYSVIISFLFSITSVSAKNYHKLLPGVNVGMDSTEVIAIAGPPSETMEVNRWYYGSDQVVISDDQVVDIRITHAIRPTRRDRKNKSKSLRPISMLRIGMHSNEVLEIAGVPNSETAGVDLYFTHRHRVELTQGKVSAVDMHIKKSLEILDWIRLNFSSGGLLFMNITIAFIMFGVALEIKFKQFKNVLIKPKSAIIGVISQFIALPALTFLLVMIIKPSPSVALGMILVAACPGGNVSNFISSLAKANIELSVSLTAFSTLAAIFMTPLNFAIWGSLYSGTADLVIPIEIDIWEMMKTVLILLGIPIVLGMAFSSKFPTTAKKIVKPFKIFSILIFTSYIIGALASNFGFFLDYIHLIILIVFIHNLLALITGFTLGSVFGLPKPDVRTLTIETGIQNSGLALVLIFNPNLFDGLGGMAFVAAWWGIWHILAGLGIASFWARKPLTNNE